MILDSITQGLISIISVSGYAGLLILMVAASSAIPLPSEVILAFSGFLVTTGRFSFLGVVIAGTIGSLIGSLILYYIGYYGGRALVDSYGKYFLLNREDLQKTEKFFAKYGDASNFFGRLLPIVRTFISFPAGLAMSSVRKFLIYTTFASLIWSTKGWSLLRRDW